MTDEKNAQGEPRAEDFSDENIPQPNWMSWDNVGDSIKGTFIKKSPKAGSDGMPDQMVYEMKNVTMNEIPCDPDAIWKVGISLALTKDGARVKDYILSRLENAKPGQRMGLKFIKTIPSKRKGFKDAKSISPYLWEMDPNYRDSESMDDPGEEGDLKINEVPFD